MQKFIVEVILPRLEKRGFVLQQTIEKQRVVALIQKLHPQRTQFQLTRLGAKGDGGYLVPDCLEDITACFSPGVARVSLFEFDCLERGMKIFMADKSVDEPNWKVDKNRYSFEKKYIGCTNNETFMTLDNWFESSDLSNDTELLLQMDIEGGEYPALMNASDELMGRFKIMVIEFHRLKNLWNRGFFDVAETVFDKILQTHVCVHLHPNNFKGPKGSVYSLFGVDIPKVMEFTFLRKDVAEIKGYQTEFPHPYDFDNAARGHYPLPGDWYRTENES
ncbi:FkbM family methyltransferase [Neolewinella agarilytica]|uniref:FkbM family methyltransferase n=1 Tax=Neolewinella agarilytica TaxID=478744 RepID=UPI002352A5CE|nr:FkbM family methyltransferase [Neolewinella agarilytica]